MKTFYKMIFFLIMFQMAALVLAGVNVFPTGTTLYSDFELNELEQNATSPQKAIAYIFLPSEDVGIFDKDIVLDSFTLLALIGAIVVLGAVVAKFTQSYAPVILAILGISFVPMITKSLSFFDKLFTQWNTPAMLYMGVTIGLGIFMLFVIMIMETPIHGRS